jgi:glycerol 2-dehydrogenase (NADP+)
LLDEQLMHWPQGNDPKTGETIPFGQSPTFVETWREMEKLLDTGKVRSIGCVA